MKLIDKETNNKVSVTNSGAIVSKNTDVTIEMIMELLYKIVFKYLGISGLIKN